MFIPPDKDIKELREGNMQTFTQIFARYFQGVEHFAYEYLRDHSEAKDVTQTVFMLLWEQRERLADETNLVNYLLTLTKYQCIDQIRKMQIRNKYVEESLDCHMLLMNQYALESLDESRLEGKELSEILYKMINELPDNCKEVFIMSRFKNLKYKEIADELHISPKTVEKKMSIALAILKKKMKDYDVMIIIYLSVFLRL